MKLKAIAIAATVVCSTLALADEHATAEGCADAKAVFANAMSDIALFNEKLKAAEKSKNENEEQKYGELKEERYETAEEVATIILACHHLGKL